MIEVPTTGGGNLRVAAVQMTTGDDVIANHRVAGALVRRAAAAGATLVVLPEKWHYIHNDKRTLAAAEDLDGASLNAVRDWAAELGVAIVAGSIIERIPGADQAFNTSVLVQPNGEASATYRKLHMFDVDVGGVSYRESAGARAGGDVVVGHAQGHAIGMSICYDLRFPELYRRLALDGAEVVVVPAAFTAATGRDHWEPLLRARAIENQTFLVAANQVGQHANGTQSYGRSLIVDPWGIVLAQAPDEQTVIVADLDFDALASVRGRLPVFDHRRPDVYGDPGPLS
ncbi:MAG: carbon-nitrogen hydrolase family protein [Thermoleophilia bacterium]|nr:carbon-nitrogen hydrolase family protein [Thermoleophilia bacterium]MDH3724890.1 carbon-nitrogen hydrolase family protein [Thermoleophilia bacterium]